MYNMDRQQLTPVLLIVSLKIFLITAVTLEKPVDLSWGYDNNTIHWPSTQKFEFTKQVFTIDGVWIAFKEFQTGEHCGTHFDAPYHFNEHGWKVGDVPLEKLIVPGITIDLRETTNQLNNNATLKVEHITKWEADNGPIPEGCVMLVNFGWSKHFHNPNEYYGSDNLQDISTLRFPGIEPEAATWMVNSKKIIGVGVDTPSIDNGLNSYHDLPVHKITSKANIYALENVKIPEDMPAKGYTLYIMPMKIMEGTGAPCRVTAVPLHQC